MSTVGAHNNPWWQSLPLVEKQSDYQITNACGICGHVRWRHGAKDGRERCKVPGCPCQQGTDWRISQFIGTPDRWEDPPDSGNWVPVINPDS